MKEIFEPTASCLATGLAPLLARGRPFAGDLQTPLARSDAHRGQREPSGVERGEGDLEARALRADAVGGRDPDLVEAGDAVLQAAQAHEGVAVLDRDALARRLDDEGGDAALVALGLGHPGHHDEEVGDDAVGGPQLDAVEDVVVAVRDGGGGEAGGVGADVRLGQQERGDVGTGKARQERVLLLLRAEDLQRLRYADRLVRGEQRADRGAGRADERQRLVVVHLGEAEAAVLDVDLHAERAELLEPVDHLVRDARLALDVGAVDLRLAEVAQLREELLAAPDVLAGGHGMGMDEVEPEAAEEELLGEARLAPVLFARGLGDLSCFALADFRCPVFSSGAVMRLTSPRVGAGGVGRGRGCVLPAGATRS